MLKDELYLIPQPKELKKKEGIFIIKKDIRIVVDEENISIAENLKKEMEDILGITPILEKTQEFCANKRIQIIEKREKLFSRRQFQEQLDNEAYILEIGKNGIEIIASDSAGLFYGAQTFLQLIENGSCLPCLTIKDWPTLKMRGIHLMLASQMPTYEYIKTFIKRLSRYKINTILLEYEDKFPYEKHPIIKHPLSFTKEQIIELLTIAKENYIEVIPLLQSFAHVGYILKHDEYSHLREVKNNPYQYCVSNEGSLSLFKDMASEIISLHKKSKYFHVGADETAYMGYCPKCSEEVARIGKSRFFINHIKKVTDYIKQAGKIPIIWDDQLVWYPENIDSFPKDVYVMYWDYITGDTKEVPFIKWDNRTWFGEEIFERIPQEIINLFRKYWDNGHFPYSHRAFPYLHFYQDKGLKIMGAPATRCGGTGNINVDNRLHIPNIRGFAQKISEANEIGIVSTSWPGCGGPLETTWHGLVATAEFSWSPKESISDFDKKFAHRFFKIKDTELIKAIYLLGGSINLQNTSESEKRTRKAFSIFKKERVKVKKNQLMIDYLILNAKMRFHLINKINIIEEVERKIIRYLDYSKWKKEKKMGNRSILTYKCTKQEEKNFSLENLEKLVGKLRKLRDELVPLKEEIKNLYPDSIEKTDVEKILATLYQEEENMVEAYISELNYFIAGHKLNNYLLEISPED